jgi:hypothetical protein
MIGPQIGQLAFRVAFMMASISAIMIFILTPGSAEYWISVITLILGIAFMGVIFLLVRVFR